VRFFRANPGESRIITVQAITNLGRRAKTLKKWPTEVFDSVGQHA
jgi:hypothetical protein